MKKTTLKHIIIKQDTCTLLAKQFWRAESPANNAKIRSSLKFLLLWQIVKVACNIYKIENNTKHSKEIICKTSARSKPATHRLLACG